MVTPEQARGFDAGPNRVAENLDPSHFYAAYVFDNAHDRRRDISVLLHGAQHLEYPVRYWWLSEAMDLQDAPDRLIVCVHHPVQGENAGMDLYSSMQQQAMKHKTKWDNLEAAHVDEYRQYGKIVVSPDSIFEPDGTPLFPEPETDPHLLFTLSRDDVQYVAQQMLDRDLGDEEIQYVADNLPGVFDWIGAVEVTINLDKVARKIGPAAHDLKQLKKKQPPKSTGDYLATLLRNF